MTRRRGDLPQGLEATVRRELRRLGGGAASGADLGSLAAAWPSAVGPAIARNAWPARMTKDGSLVVHTASSSWAQELTQLEDEIRTRLGPERPARLRFVVGPLPEPDRPIAPDLSRPLHKPTAADRLTAREIARTIEDPALREVVAEAVSRSLAAARARAPDRPV